MGTLCPACAASPSRGAGLPSGPIASSPAASTPAAPRRPLSSATGTVSRTASAEITANSPSGYQILRELGRGGMGVVYEARDTRLSRVVALKMMLAGGYAAARDFERFRREAEAVARLDHPHIVRVFEVGEHVGLPYMTLEFCPGGALSSRLTGKPMPARAAAAVLEPIASAVQAAHTAGVLHRDIKPANILLAADGSPKLTDFGLAKPIDSQAVTRTGEAVGTLSYMAPEQAEAAKFVGPAADVYALGAVLYELLTGRPPLVGESETHTLYMLLSEDPVPVRQLVPTVPADLETICHKCLHKEPARRYASAAALAADLRAFREGAGIQARPMGQVERLARLARRNPVLVALAGMTALGLLAVLIVGAVYSAQLAERNAALTAAVEAQTQARQAAEAARDAEQSARRDADRQRLAAEENFGLAQKAVRECLDLARTHTVFQRPGQQEARALLLRVAEPYYEKFAAVADTSDQRHELILARIHKADRQRELDARAEAIATYRTAVAELERLVAEAPSVRRYRTNLAVGQGKLASALMENGEAVAAEKAYRDSLEGRLRLVQEQPDDPELRSGLAAAHNNIALLYKITGRRDAAVRSHTEALAIQRELVARFPDSEFYPVELSQSHNNLGNLALDVGDFGEAERQYREALRLREGHAIRVPPELRGDIATAHANLANVFKAAGRLADAQSEIAAALRVQEQLVRDNPDVLTYRAALAVSHNNHGNILHAVGRVAEAERAYRAGLEIRQKLSLDQPRVLTYRSDLAGSHNNVANMQMALGDLTGAEAAYRSAIALGEELTRRQPTVVEYRANLANAYGNASRVPIQRADYVAAERLLRRAVELREPLAAAAPGEVDAQGDLALSRCYLGYAIYEQGRHLDAEGLFRLALSAQLTNFAAMPRAIRHRRELAVTEYHYALLLSKIGRKDLAELMYWASVVRRAQLARELPEAAEHRQELGASLNNLAALVLERRDAAATERLYRWSMALREELLAGDPSSDRSRSELAASHSGLAITLLRLTPRTALGGYHAHRSVELYRPLRQAHPDNAAYKTGLEKAMLLEALAQRKLVLEALGK